jgi:hypothetical protein
VETESKFLESGLALVGRPLVKGHHMMPVCLVNVTDNVQQIHDDIMATKQTTIEGEKASDSEVNVEVVLCNHLQEVSDRFSLYLSSAQMLKVEKIDRTRILVLTYIQENQRDLDLYSPLSTDVLHVQFP